MTGVSRDSMLERIRSNIERYGFHLYVIAGGQAPRFAYTIGAGPTKGAELILAGAALYSQQEVAKIIEAILSRMPRLSSDGSAVEIGALGSFSFGEVDSSWASTMALGAIDYYETDAIRALQVLPDATHRTIDVPDLALPRSAQHQPAWRWLWEPWPYQVPERSVAVTNLGALRGSPVTEVARWEIDQWELFAGAGPDVAKADIRKVPLGTLLAADPSLEVVTSLEIGKGLWRGRSDLEWHEWAR
jgi:hypothetical protein